ncbi:Complex I intermediate-associated protein 30 (CIA30) [Cognatiyoonia koreensis]|uniref:Complex I intermediate-associated protein 30 (CIA30) n=2 Tax=Cognatiyoonia koreensis TaxID=364200 RepID=A0A1I0N6Z8_9RHOB|nr:Complex I intermediate-associated protein 30 (CIA30) [Cognatiyoonia koreensis]
MLLEDFSDGAERRWQYLSDRVMGGVSDGGAVIGQEDGARFALLAGDVSTANNGGFIQLRRDLVTALPANSTGLEMTVRGRNGPYFVHLRTRDTRRPWQFYQAQFPTSEGWTDVALTWADFSAKGRGLTATLAPTDIVSIGLVAYGRDHAAEVAIRSITVTQD